MRQPRSRIIFGEKYTYEYKKELSDGEASLDGWHCPKSRIIYLDQEIKGKPLDVLTRLHEEYHAVISVTGISGALPNGLEEVIVENLSEYTFKHYLKRLLRF